MLQRTEPTIAPSQFVWGRLQKKGAQLLSEALRLRPLLVDPETAAIESVRDGSKRELIAYLRSDRPLSPRLRRFVADLLANKVERRGRPPTLRIGLITDMELLVSAAHDCEKTWRQVGYTNRGPGGQSIHLESARWALERLEKSDRLAGEIAERLRKGRVRPHIERTKASYKRHRRTLEAALGDWRKRSRIISAPNLPN